MSVADNLAFREFDRAPFAAGGWWLNGAQFHDNALRKIERYKIKTRSDDTPIGELSGGNVQRTVLVRELLIFDKHSNIRMEDRLVSRRRRREVCGAAFA